jgi:hypothetical protein
MFWYFLPSLTLIGALSLNWFLIAAVSWAATLLIISLAGQRLLGSDAFAIWNARYGVSWLLATMALECLLLWLVVGFVAGDLYTYARWGLLASAALTVFYFLSEVVKPFSRLKSDR